MEEEPKGAESQSGSPLPPVVQRAVTFVKAHPKTAMAVGAGLSLVAGWELLGAALVGGIVTLALGRLRASPPEHKEAPPTPPGPARSRRAGRPPRAPPSPW